MLFQPSLTKLTAYGIHAPKAEDTFATLVGLLLFGHE